MKAVPDTLGGVYDLKSPRPQYLAKLGNVMIGGMGCDRELHLPGLSQKVAAAEDLTVVDHEILR